MLGLNALASAPTPSFPWAEQENTDLIPADKLDQRPRAEPKTQVDARVDAGVSDWAEEGDTSSIPLVKLGLAPSASSWFWAASAFGPFTANTAKTMSLRDFPISARGLTTPGPPGRP